MSLLALVRMLVWYRRSPRGWDAVTPDILRSKGTWQPGREPNQAEVDTWFWRMTAGETTEKPPL